MKPKDEGFVYVTPEIKKVSFTRPGKFTVFLNDGREIVLPIKNFPSLDKVPVSQRKNYQILTGQSGSMLTWPDCDEVYHIQDFLGVPENYIYKG